MAYEIPYDSNYGEWYGVPQNVTRLSAVLEQTTDEEEENSIGLITASWDMPDNGGTFIAQLSTDGENFYIAENNITQNSIELIVDADTDYYLKIITVLGGNQSEGTVSGLLSATDIPTPSAPIITVTPSGMRIDVGIIPQGYTANILIDDGETVDEVETSEAETSYLCVAGTYTISVAFMDINGNTGNYSVSVSATVTDVSVIYNLKTPLLSAYIVVDDGGDYYTDSAGEVILQSNAQTFKKYNNLPAIAGVFHRNNYRTPLLISTVEDAVKIQSGNNTPWNAQGSFEDEDGVVWYYCSYDGSNDNWSNSYVAQNFPEVNNGTRYENNNIVGAAKKLLEEANPTLFATETIEENLFYPTNYALSSGDTITDTDLKSLIAYHRPISINGTVYTPSDYTNGTYTYYALKNGTSSAEIGKVQIDSSWVITITTESSGGGGGYILPIASASTLGGVKVGTNLSIDANGVLSATDTTYSDFVGSGSSAAHGLVPVPPSTAGTSKYLREDGTWATPSGGGGGGGSYTAGDGIDITNDVISLETASANNIGGIKVGSGLSIDANGVLSATGGGGGGGSFTQNLLYSGNWTSGNIILSDSIQNYDDFVVVVNNTANTEFAWAVTNIVIKDVLINTTSASPIAIYGEASRKFCFYYVDDTHLGFESRSTYAVRRIYGRKY